MEVSCRRNVLQRPVLSLEGAARIGGEPSYLGPATAWAGWRGNEANIVISASQLPCGQLFAVTRKGLQLLTARQGLANDEPTPRSPRKA